jgi:hypothetical protein
LIATADHPVADGSNWYSRPFAAVQTIRLGHRKAGVQRSSERPTSA